MSIDQDKNVIWKESIIRNNIYLYISRRILNRTKFSYFYSFFIFRQITSSYREIFRFPIYTYISTSRSKNFDEISLSTRSSMDKVPLSSSS